MLNKTRIPEPWFDFWGPVVSRALNAYDFKSASWKYFPHAGGIYDNEEFNPLLWEIWELVVMKAYEVLNGSDDTKHKRKR